MRFYYLFAEVVACTLVFTVVHFTIMRSNAHAYTHTTNSTHTDSTHTIGVQFLDAMYFSLVTQSTVGYGSIVPSTPLAKVAAGVQVLTTLFFVVRWATHT